MADMRVSLTEPGGRFRGYTLGVTGAILVQLGHRFPFQLVSRGKLVAVRLSSEVRLRQKRYQLLGLIAKEALSQLSYRPKNRFDSGQSQPKAGAGPLC